MSIQPQDRSVRVSLYFVCLAAGVPAFAQEQAVTLDPLAVTGTYVPASTFDVPASLDIVTRDQFAEGQAGVNLSEALSRVPGVVVQNRQNYAQDLQVSTRGYGARAAFGIRGIKVLSDGIPASTPDGQGQAASLNLDVADRVEVLRGPASALYGSNAGGGIQMFSKDGSGPATIGASTLLGSDGFLKNRLYSQGGNDQAGFVLDASRMDTDGYRDHSAARRDQTFAKVHVRPDEDSRLALIFNTLEQNGTQDPLGQTWSGYKQDPRSVIPQAEQYNTRKSIHHQQVGLNYERDFGDATLQFNAYAGKRSVIQYLSIPKGTPANERGGGVVDFDREFHGGTLRWIQPVTAVPGALTLTFGADYDQSRDDRRGYQNYSGTQLGVKGELRRDEVDTATSLDPYIQAHWELDRWTLDAGLRRSSMEMEVDDHYLSNGDSSGSKKYQRTTPSLSVMYAFTPDLHGYVSAGKAFETPTQAEMAYAPGVSETFNFGLKPATSTQYEIGLKARLTERSRLNVAVFEIHTDDELVVAGSNSGRTSYTNAGKTLRRGLEVGLQQQLAADWELNLAYTHLDATYRDDVIGGTSQIEKGNRLPGVPKDSLFGELVWKPVAGLSTALEGQYRSQVYVEDSNDQKAAPAYTVFNWRARMEQQLDRFTVYEMVRLDNLLDRRYVGSVIVGDGNGRYYEAAPGRSWYAGAGVEYRF
ncbi:TonB-dependent receptor family protein [Pseudomonas sp. Marseille-P9899]|uniref:TonB-dependent receptor family protein n=1 Tax=Pseudomonas sp. Marseille-P9899 TaxID=2730401 RepID=UPI001589F7EA|nr:TonB-dependent receptor [Pseudomonas sp. Marseille-P9899]